MPRPKRPIEPLECDPVPLSDLEEAVKEIIAAPLRDDQHWENWEPTKEEREQKFKLKRRS